MKFCFGDIVVVDDCFIGVVVKCWSDERTGEYSYDVYVRSHNIIVKYRECDIERYMVRHKELDEEEMFYQQQALKGGD